MPLRLLAALLTALVLTGTAQAQNIVDRANAAAAAGPTVLRVDPNYGRFRSPPPGLNRAELYETRAVPVPHVMNGGGFGLTGNDYYSEAATEGSLRVRNHVNHFILAPALRAKLP